MIKLLIILAPRHMVGDHPRALLVCSLSVGGELGLGWGWGGLGRESCSVCREEALDTSVAASTTSLGRQFQSLFVLSRKEELLYCVLAWMSLNCLS